MCDLETPGRLKNKVHCSEKKKTISVEADIIDLDYMMHVAICCPVLRQNGGRSSVIENQVVRKLKGFLQCSSGCYHFGN